MCKSLLGVHCRGGDSVAPRLDQPWTLPAIELCEDQPRSRLPGQSRSSSPRYVC